MGLANGEFVKYRNERFYNPQSEIPNPKSQCFPHSLYLLFADLEVVPIPGEDFEGDRFIILDVFEFSHNPFEIDDPGADG